MRQGDKAEPRGSHIQFLYQSSIRELQIFLNKIQAMVQCVGLMALPNCYLETAFVIASHLRREPGEAVAAYKEDEFAGCGGARL